MQIGFRVETREIEMSRREDEWQQAAKASALTNLKTATFRSEFTSTPTDQTTERELLVISIERA